MVIYKKNKKVLICPECGNLHFEFIPSCGFYCTKCGNRVNTLVKEKTNIIGKEVLLES